MSALLNRSAPVAASELTSRLIQDSRQKRRRNRLSQWLRRHRATLAWLSPIVVLTGVLDGVNLAGAPVHSYGESTIAMRAWSIVHLGQLTPYTYTYDQPPLGWLQIAGWTGLTGGFARYPLAVDAAREAMVASAVIAVVLIWFVARRLGLGRTASGIASVIFALSPFAIALHRTVYLNNVATVWTLLAVLLATSRRRQLLGFTASAIAMGVAILSSETLILALPLVAVVMWRRAYPENRRYTLSIAAAVVLLICAAFVVFAFVRGQLFPSAVHPSLIDGVMSQFTPNETLQGPVLIPALPVAALLVALLVDRGVRMRRFRGLVGRVRIASVAVIVAIAVGALAPSWIPQYRVLLGVGGASASATGASNPLEASAQRAEGWLTSNVPRNSRLIVDNTMWVGVVASGFSTDNVIAFDKLDTDATVKALSPKGWKDSDFVVSTETMRSATTARAAHSAIANSVVVASFGKGNENIQVRRIVPAGASAARIQQVGELAERAAVGNEIADNPTVSIGSADVDLLRSGRVDPRIPLLVGQLAPAGRVELARFPVISGESGLRIRQVVIASVDGRALSSNGRLTAAGRDIVTALKGSFAAQSGTAVPDGLLLRFSVDVPAGIIQ